MGQLIRSVFRSDLKIDLIIILISQISSDGTDSRIDSS